MVAATALEASTPRAACSFVMTVDKAVRSEVVTFAALATSVPSRASWTCRAMIWCSSVSCACWNFVVLLGSKV